MQICAAEAHTESASIQLVRNSNIMKIHLSNLPKGTGEADVEKLTEEYGDVISVEMLGESDSGNLESIVALKEDDRVVVDAIADKLNGLNWKGATIGAKVLLYQEDEKLSGAGKKDNEKK